MAIDEKHPRLQQAQVEPCDADGVNCFVVGLVACLVLLAVLLLTSAPAWQVHSALAGLAVGAVGLGYCLWRRR